MTLDGPYQGRSVDPFIDDARPPVDLDNAVDFWCIDARLTNGGRDAFLLLDQAAWKSRAEQFKDASIPPGKISAVLPTAIGWLEISMDQTLVLASSPVERLDKTGLALLKPCAHQMRMSLTLLSPDIDNPAIIGRPDRLMRGNHQEIVWIPFTVD